MRKFLMVGDARMNIIDETKEAGYDEDGKRIRVVKKPEEVKQATPVHSDYTAAHTEQQE